DENPDNFLYANNGDGSFTAVTGGPVVTDGGISVGGSWGDYDNDGDLDLFVANDNTQRNFLYANNGDGSFTAVTTGPVVTIFTSSAGSSWGDYDNDGDLDLFVTTAGLNHNNFLYANNGNANHWINLALVGTQSNVSAIGARVSLKATIGGSPSWQLTEISGQTGYLSQNSLNAEFGLGDATSIDTIRIEWPSGFVWDTSHVAVDQFLTIVEVVIVTDMEIVTGVGAVAFTGTGLTMNFTSHSGADTIEVQAIPAGPGGTLPVDVTLEAERYWIITHSGSGSFTLDLTLNLGTAAFTAEDQQQSVRLLLLRRDSEGTLPWEIASYGASATDSTVTFAGLTGFSQFAIGRSTETEGPTIESLEASPDPNMSDPITVSATVTDAAGTRLVRLYYAPGELANYVELPMVSQGGDKYSGTIPGSAVTASGVAYYVYAEDGLGNVSRSDSLSVQVNFSAGTLTTMLAGSAFSDGFPYEKWRLISLPGNLDNKTVLGTIGDMLGGATSDLTWNIFRYVGPGLGDYQEANSFEIGESYFLKQVSSEQAVHFSLGAGQSYDLTGLSITMQPRKWRLVSAPYPFVVAMDANPSTFIGPYTYGAFGSGGQEGWSLGQVQTTFQPWGGYIIYNNTDQTQTLEIRSSALSKSILAQDNSKAAPGWLLNLTAEGQDYFDTGNIIGRTTDATEGLDDYDHPEPPTVRDGHLSMTVGESDREHSVPRTSDIRSIQVLDGVWDVAMSTRGESGPIHLTYSLEGNPLPIIALIDMLTQEVYRLSEGEQPAEITDFNERIPHRLKVVAGS
ncbi:MAG: CRTAC1 family protein, partial [Candidatus Marinimicrobia bacterium]|nr:CRTAC1 family protein [Candidatus Neomarinimicrobiota bacterium]